MNGLWSGMGIFASLSRSQKEAIGLLQIGTFLEYFDLMLYVYMAVLLNELFFPKADPHTAALLSAFAFCSTWVLRPFGALIFGWIGDNIGRKSTVILTTSMMAISCLIMANLPTYAQIGISAAWIVTICRIVQGLSSMGEIVGAQIYITEITKPPAQYPAVSLIRFASSIGTVCAIGIAAVVTRYECNWRIAFWIGAGIAVVGSIARTRLRETPDFVDLKKIKQREIEEKKTNKDVKSLELSRFELSCKKIKIPRIDICAYFSIYCGWPLMFYLIFIYFNPILKSYGYSSEDVIFHNFWLSLVGTIYDGILIAICSKIYPLTILKIRTRALFFLMLFFPFIVTTLTTPIHVFLLQSTILILNLCSLPADSIFIKHFPVFKRFTMTSLVYASSRAIMHIISAFGLVYLTEAFGHYGVWIIALPVTLGFLWGVNHFEKLENQKQIHTPLSTKLDEHKLAG